MLLWVIAAGIGVGSAVLSYRGATVRGRRSLATLRAFAATIVAAILLGAPAGRAAAPRALVVLDVSASWRRGGDTAAWTEARRRALAAGADTLWLAGDSLRPGKPPAAPVDVATRLAPAVMRARAAGRPLLLVTDGEADDAGTLGALPPGSRIVIMPRASRADLAVTDLDVPGAAVSGDSLVVRATIRAGDAAVPAARVTLLLDGRVAAMIPLQAFEARGERVVTLHALAPAAPGVVLVAAVVSAPGDAETANDSAAAPVTVARAAGVVFASTAPDEDMRALVPLLRRTLALPARGFLRVAPGRWRREGTLEAATEQEVRAALREAPVAILHGDTALLGAPRALATGALLLLPTTDPGAGEWYAIGAPASPVAGALAGTPWDSLPPVALAVRGAAGEWTALDLARSRRFDPRGAIAGSQRGRRQVVVTATGFWRWRFRGGASDAAYAVLWGGILDWLAADRHDPRAAFPMSGVLREGEPVEWRRMNATAPASLSVTLRRRGTKEADTLRLEFAAGQATVLSPPLARGVYDAAIPGGAAVLAVNASREWLPRSPALREAVVSGAGAGGSAPPLRDRGWAYLVAIVALCFEWWLRRRAGLR